MIAQDEIQRLTDGLGALAEAMAMEGRFGAAGAVHAARVAIRGLWAELHPAPPEPAQEPTA